MSRLLSCSNQLMRWIPAALAMQSVALGLSLAISVSSADAQDKMPAEVAVSVEPLVVRAPSLDPSMMKYICDDGGCLAMEYLRFRRCSLTSVDPRFLYRTPTIEERNACYFAWQDRFYSRCEIRVDDPNAPASVKGLGQVLPGVAKIVGGDFCIDGGCSRVAEIKFWDCIALIPHPRATTDFRTYPLTDAEYRDSISKCSVKYADDLKLCPGIGKTDPAEGDAPIVEKPKSDVEIGIQK